MKVSYLFTSMLTCLKGGTVSRTMRSLCHLFKQYVVDGEVTTTVLLILNQLQLKNCSAGLKERLSPVYQVLTMTRQNHKDRILDIELEKMIPVLPQWKAAPLVHGSTTVAHTGVLYSCHFPSLKAYASYV